MNISPHPKPQSLGKQNSGENVIRGVLPPASGEHCVIFSHFLFGGSENSFVLSFLSKPCEQILGHTKWGTWSLTSFSASAYFVILLTQVMCPSWPTETRFAARSWGVTGTSTKESTSLPYNQAQVSVFPHKSWHVNHVARTRVVKRKLLISWWVGLL